MNSKLYVGNLSFRTTDAQLRETFGQFGTVTDVYVASDKMTGRPRGFAFVTLGSDTDAKLAIEKMNGVDLDGRNLSVSEAKPREEMGSPRSGSRSGAYVGGNSRY